jgi:hypothetical protein
MASMFLPSIFLPPVFVREERKTDSGPAERLRAEKWNQGGIARIGAPLSIGLWLLGVGCGSASSGAL